MKILPTLSKEITQMDLNKVSWKILGNENLIWKIFKHNILDQKTF